jgi:phosphoglycolate phosphatase
VNLILFDLDGTLYSSRSILPDAYRAGIESFNEAFDRDVEVPANGMIFDQVGDPVDEIYENLFPELSPTDRNRLQQKIFSELLQRIRQAEGELYDGTRRVLSKLSRSYHLGLVTNAQTEYMKNVLQTHALDRFFERTLCNDDAPNGTKSEIVGQQLKYFRVAGEEALMVGDRSSDRRAARKNGLTFVGCQFGYGSSDLFEQAPDIDSLPELLDQIPGQDG